MLRISPNLVTLVPENGTFWRKANREALLNRLTARWTSAGAVDRRVVAVRKVAAAAAVVVVGRRRWAAGAEVAARTGLAAWPSAEPQWEGVGAFLPAAAAVVVALMEAASPDAMPDWKIQVLAKHCVSWQSHV